MAYMIKVGGIFLAVLFVANILCVDIAEGLARQGDRYDTLARDNSVYNVGPLITMTLGVGTALFSPVVALPVVVLAAPLIEGALLYKGKDTIQKEYKIGQWLMRQFNKLPVSQQEKFIQNWPAEKNYALTLFMSVLKRNQRLLCRPQ